MAKVKTTPSAEAGEPAKPRVTFTITGYFELDDQVGIADATTAMQEAVEQLRGMGSATCKAQFPAAEMEIG